METIDFLKTSTNNSHYTENDIKLFVGSLQYNVVFDMGFKVFHSSLKDTKYCNCPCNTYMAPWRNQFKLNNIGLRDKYGLFPACNGIKVTSSELIEHLGCDKVQNFPLHFGVSIYFHFL